MTKKKQWGGVICATQLAGGLLLKKLKYLLFIASRTLLQKHAEFNRLL